MSFDDSVLFFVACIGLCLVFAIAGMIAEWLDNHPHIARRFWK